MHPSASLLSNAGIAAIALAAAALFLLGIRRVRPAWTGRAAAAVLLWLLLTGALAAAGVLLRFDWKPPPFLLMIVATFALGITAGLSSVGKALAQLPLWLLIAVHGLRLPLELIMHEAGREGTMPTVLSFGGRNFDIVTGVSALLGPGCCAPALRGSSAGPGPSWASACYSTLPTSP